MKKIKIYTVLVIVGVAVFTIIINSCKKVSKLKSPEVTAQSTSKDASVMTSEDSIFTKKIIWFDSIMKNYAAVTGYTNSKEYSSDSALWYLEAWFNAKYAYTDEHYSKTDAKTDSLSLNLSSNNTVNMDNLAVAENELYNKVKNLFRQSGLSNKELLLLDLQITRTGISNILISINPVFGERTEMTVSYDPFDSSWYYGEMLGDCDLSTIENTDAAQKISEAIMANKPIYLPCAGCYYTYSDIDTIPLQGNEYQNSNGEYLIFYIVRPDGNFTPDDKCLNPDEMNFHYHGEETVIYDTLVSLLNKSFMSCELQGLQDGDASGTPRIRHNNILFFGIRHLHHPGIGFITKEYITD